MLGKHVRGQLRRGFESPPLRHFNEADMSRDRIQRRKFLKSTALGGAAILAPGRSSWAAVKAEVSERRVISQNPARYHGWPTLATRVSGQLLLACSGGRESHVCPFGRVELMRSDDNGLSWTFPRVVMDGGIDDRDAGVMETSSGAMLITTFTSNAYEPMLAAAEAKPGSWDEKRLERWQAAHYRLSRPARKASLGVWMIRSTNGGITWSGRYRTIVNSPHGPIELSNGLLLYAGKELYYGDTRIGAAVSLDDGVSWKWGGTIPTRSTSIPRWRAGQDALGHRSCEKTSAMSSGGPPLIRMRRRGTVSYALLSPNAGIREPEPTRPPTLTNISSARAPCGGRPSRFPPSRPTSRPAISSRWPAPPTSTAWRWRISS